MSYVPFHNRVSEPSRPSVRYSSPDTYRGGPQKESTPEPELYDFELAHREQEARSEYDAGPSRKRRREDHGEDSNGYEQAEAQPPHQSQASSSRRGAPPPVEQMTLETPIVPSIFGIAPRNEFTKTIGEFIMGNCRGVANVEIEVKLGMLHGPDQQKRIRLPTMTEMIVPPDYPAVGRFASTMNKAQHASLNRLLNGAVEGSMRTATPLYFYRAQQIDSFHNAPGGKVRVSRDRAGNIIAGGVVRKRRIADLNIYSPREAFDWRVSASVEDPVEVPSGPPLSTRDKDRACYRHQLCQVDLTVVTAKDGDGGRPSVSFELEIEILDVPTLISEGEKEERGEANRFDEILQSVLDTARMLIRNV